MRDLETAFTTPEAKRRYVRQLFATIADRYDFITVVLSYGQDRRWKRRLIREARLERGDRVLDLACGTGFWFPHYAEHCTAVTMFDQSAGMLEQARRKAG